MVFPQQFYIFLDVLGVNKNANPDELKKAYYGLA